MLDPDSLEVSVEEAARRLRQEPGAVYLDVRTVTEFVDGHPPDALNVPFVIPDARTGAPVLNAAFLRTVRTHVDAQQPILCGCATGVRSLYAVQMLRSAGFERAVNVDAGFAGKTDPLGRVVAPGWAASGFAVETGDGGSRSYAALRDSADGADGAGE